MVRGEPVSPSAEGAGAAGGIKERRRISIRNPEVIHERIKVANDDFDGAIGDKRFKEAADQKSNTFFHHAKERPT